MADKTFTINNETGNRVDASGDSVRSLVQLDYKAYESWTYNAVDSNNVAIDLSTATTWRFALDDNLNYSSDPWVRILNADIDSSSSATGVLVMTMDSNTEAFRVGTNKLRFKQTYTKLQGFDASGYEKFAFNIPVLAMGNVDPTGGTPAEADEYYDKDEADARFAHIQSTATEDNVTTFDGDGDIQDSTIAIADLVALISESTSTSQTCADDTVTTITVLDITAYTACQLVFTLDDGTNLTRQSFGLGYDGTGVTDDGGEMMVIQGVPISGVSVSFSISGDNLNLIITTSSVGSTVDCTYLVNNRIT